MPLVKPCELPPTAMLQKYRQGNGYTDCYVTEVPLAVSQADFIRAFYTSALFKLERSLLKWFAGRPSTDLDAHELAAAQRSSFAAWRVEGQTADQLLLADFTGRTRSWLMATPAGPSSTRLYFGSAVTSKRTPTGGAGGPGMGLAFHALLGFHRLYSRLLLQGARARVIRLSGTAPAP